MNNEFINDLTKSATNPQAFAEKLIEANKNLVESFSKNVLPAWQEFSKQVPAKAIENIQVYSELNTKLVSDLQKTVEKNSVDFPAVFQVFSNYQKDLLAHNTGLVEKYCTDMANNVKNAQEKFNETVKV
jgi:uncharacterized protein YdiU (UPF0061 family)